MNEFKQSLFPLPAKEFHEAKVWWNLKSPSTQTKLKKKYDLETYADLVAFYLEQNK